MGDGANLLLGEAVNPVSNLTLLVAQFERNHAVSHTPKTFQYSNVPIWSSNITPRCVKVSRTYAGDCGSPVRVALGRRAPRAIATAPEGGELPKKGGEKRG